jgi:hypothetical protein
MEYGENMDVPSASMTLFLIAVSVGRWFIVLSLGWSRSHACWSAASLAAYAMNAAKFAVTVGTGRCGLAGTGCMTGLLVVSRTGVLDKTSTSESWDARYTSHPLWSPCNPSSFFLVSSASFWEFGPCLLNNLSFMTR